MPDSSVRITRLLALVMVLSACQDSPPVASPLERGFKLYVEEPVLSMGPSGSWNSGLMDPGAVIFHDGQFHMFYDAVPSFPALIEVGSRNTSTYLATWTE